MKTYILHAQKYVDTLFVHFKSGVASQFCSVLTKENLNITASNDFQQLCASNFGWRRPSCPHAQTEVLIKWFSEFDVGELES